MQGALLHAASRARTALWFAAAATVQVLIVVRLLGVSQEDAMSVVVPAALAAPFILLGLLYSPRASVLTVPILLIIPVWVFGFTMSEGILFGALFFGLLRFLMSGERARAPRMVEVLFAAYVVWAALTMVQAVEAKEALKAWKQIVVHFAAFLAGLRLLGDRGARPLVRVIALFGIVIGLQLVATVLAHGFSLSHLAMRVPSMTDLGWGFSVYVAAVAALTAAASIALSLYGRSWERMLGVAGLAAAVLVSNATLSRGGTLAIAVGLLVTAALELRRRFLLVVAIVGVPLATYLFSSLGQATLERFVRPQALPSVAARLVFYQEGFTIAKAHPLFGVGPGQLPYNTHLYIGPNPHNFLLKNAIDLGLPGLALYLLILGALAARIFRLRRVQTREARLFALCLTLLLSIALTNALYEPTLEGWVYGCVFWMLAGALYAASEDPATQEGPAA